MLSAAFLIDALWVHTKCVKQVCRIIGGRFRGSYGGLVEPLVWLKNVFFFYGKFLDKFDQI